MGFLVAAHFVPSLLAHINILGPTSPEERLGQILSPKGIPSAEVALGEGRQVLHHMGDSLAPPGPSAPFQACTAHTCPTRSRSPHRSSNIPRAPDLQLPGHLFRNPLSTLSYSHLRPVFGRLPDFGPFEGRDHLSLPWWLTPRIH